jgi:hypothetical protein
MTDYQTHNLDYSICGARLAAIVEFQGSPDHMTRSPLLLYIAYKEGRRLIPSGEKRTIHASSPHIPFDSHNPKRICGAD